MLKVKHQADYLKSTVVNVQAVESLRKDKSFQLKNRTRRQYNPDDTNIAKLFLMIREHKIGSPELDKTNAIKELLTQVQNINDIDLNDGGNTPLHVAVSKEHQDIVELLLNTSGTDVNIQNNQGDTPLHIAVSKDNEELVRLLLSKKAEVNTENKGKETPLDIAKSSTQPNKEKIIEILEEHLKKSSNQVRRLSPQEKEVHDKLIKFVEDFVLIYESSLSEYYARLENKKGKSGKWADFANKAVDIVKSGTEGTEDTRIKAFSLIGINVLQGAISSIGIKHNREELKKLINQLYIFKKDPIKVREELIKSGVEIFQNFESQFVQVKADGSWERAMTKLAEDAVSRVVDYYRKNTEKEFCASSITEGIVFGESKRYRQTSTGSPRIKSGHTLESKNSWNTAQLFDKAGLVTIKNDGNADKYYKRKDGKSNTSKYGYRLLFKWENINEDYDQEISPREEYRYVLRPGEKGNLVKDILEVLNKKGGNLIETRQVENSEEIVEAIKQSAEEAFNELDDYIDKNFNELLSYIESNQNEIKRAFDELMSQHQEASQQRHKIADSIKEGREENKEGFKQAGQKLDKIHSIIVAGQQVRESIWFDVKKPVRLFTGRKEELLDLHNKIQRSSKKVTVISQITSISGLGGIGKTELARQYIQEYSKDYYNNVIWVNAESEVTLIESFTRLAKDKLRIDTRDESGKEKNIKSIVEEVYKFFSNSKSLFIFDNVEKNNNLNEFLPLRDLLPGGNGPYVLITSCNREWEKGIEVINLNELKSEEAIEFVKRGLGIEDESQNKEIKALVEKLQHFPLAIQQAIAYIEDQGVTREFDIDDYLEEYEKKTKDLLDSAAFKGIDNDYAKTTLTTWKITIDKIASDKEYGKLALRILNIISYLAPDKISREVFLGLTGSSEEELRSAVRLLIKYCVVNGEQKQNVLSTHKLVQEVTRIALAEEGKSEEVMKETFELLRASFPYGSDKLEDYVKKQQLLPHLEVFLSHIDNWLKKKPEDKEKIEKDYLENLLIWMSDGYLNLDNPKRQRELLERALPIIENHYGKDHFEVAEPLVNLSIAYTALGDAQRAKELLEKALKIEKNHYGENHFQVAKILVNLSITYRALGDYERAKELLEKALPILEKHYRAELFPVAKVLVSLSISYVALGDYERAKELLERALLILGNNYREDHFEAAITLENLGITYKGLGDYERAKELLGRALPIFKKRYGEDHFEVAITLVNLGVTYGALNDHQKQKELLEKALPTLENHYGKDHLEVAKTLVNLSNAYVALGDYQRTKELIEKALPTLEKHYGKDHLEVAKTLVNLSNAYVALGDYQRTKELVERALPILENHYGEDHSKVAKTLVNLSNAYVALGDDQRAKELLEKALPTLEKHYGKDHLEVAKTLVNLSNAYVALGDYQRTKELVERALPILKKHYGEGHSEVAKTLVNLSISYVVLGDNQRAKELLKRALPILEKHYGEDHFEVAKVLVNLSISYVALGDYQRAKELLERALPILYSHYGAEHFEVAVALENLGIAYIALGDNQRAKELLERALPILYSHYGAEHFEVAVALENLGIAYIALGDNQRAKELLERTSAIYQGGKVSIEKCLSKREVEGKCLFKWEDVNEFNVKKDEKRDFSKIEVDSKKFIDYIKDLPEEKRSQLIELVDKVQVTGRFRDLIDRLTSNQKVMNHLNRVKKISSIAMYGMMAKNVLADFLNGDYQGVAINIGFIAGGQGFAKVAESASIKGLKLASEGKLLLGRSLRAASPFLARGTSAFVVYDLVNQIKAFKNGTKEALVSVIGDSIYLGVDAAEIGIEVAEAFEVLEGVSSVTGPIGATVGAVVLIGTDVYMAVKRVDKIDQLVHLTETEKFIEGLRAFIGMQPEKYIQELIEEEQFYNQLVKQGFEYLKEHSDVQSYVFPIGKSFVNFCRKVLYPTAGTIIRYYTEECTTKFEIDLDSTVLLDKKRTDIKWSRVRLNDPRDGKLFCLPKGDYQSASSDGSYLCENAIGLSDNKTEGYTLINLEEGEDYAKGFKDSRNIFVVNDGSKRYYGGNKDDIFVLQGDLIEGSLYGEGGIDTLDLTGFAQEAASMDVYLNANIGIIVYKRSGYPGFKINEVEKVLGRKAKADHIFSACNTKFLDGNGGAEDQLDYIQIENSNCRYDIQAIVRPYTEIDNMALKGNFGYIVPFQKGSASVKLLANLESNHRFVFDYVLADAKSVDIEGQNSIKFDFFPKGANGNFNITILYNIMNNITYQLKDGTEIKVSRERNLYAIQSTNKTIDEIIESYPAIANRLNMTIAVQSDNESILVGHGKCELLHNNPIHNSHLIGNGGENIYVITIASGKQRYDHSVFSIPQVNIYNLDKASSIDTLDLRNVIKIIQDDLKIHIGLSRISQDGNDLLVKLEAEMGQNFSVRVLTVRLKNGLNWYQKLNIITNSAPMKISSELELKPLPLMFEKDKEVIVVTDQDVEKGTELITSRKGGNYTFVRNNGCDLMITNVFDSTITKNDLCTIILSKFYKMPKMKTLSIKFADKEIVLKNHQEEISAARDVNIVKKEYKDQVYNDVFNRTSTEEISSEVILSDQPIANEHKHRYEHNRHQIRHRRSENIASSGARPSSWINDLFGWVKSSIGGFRAALPETSANYSNTAGTSQFSSEVCVSNNVGLGLFLLQSFLDKKYPLPKFCSVTHEEALANTLNIVEEFEKTLEKTAKQSGVLVKDVNFFKVYLDIAGHVRNERYSKIPNTLYSVAKEACPKNEKFLSILKGNIEKMFDGQQIVNSGYQPNDIADNKPRSYLNNTTVSKQLQRSYHAISS